MNCPICNSPLLVSKLRPKSDVGTTDVFIVQDLVCPNPKCANWFGTDLGNPKTVVATVENRWE
jgi:hypothetical protein